MIPKEFINTIEQQKEYNNYMAQFEYEEIPEEFAHLPPSEVQRKEYEASPEYKLEKLIKESFTKEYNKLTEARSYFLGCTYDIYTTTYKTRLQAFKDLYMDAEEHNFIHEELQAITFCNLPKYIDTKLLKSINYSLERTKDFLITKLNELKFKVDFSVNEKGTEILSIKNNQSDLTIRKIDNSMLKWEGTETDLIELGKAIYEAKYINHNIKQKEFFNLLMSFFNKNVPNPTKALQNIRNRKIDETKLIHRLEQKLRDWQSNYG
jgi:hypothetical protein